MPISASPPAVPPRPSLARRGAVALGLLLGLTVLSLTSGALASAARPVTTRTTSGSPAPAALGARIHPTTTTTPAKATTTTTATTGRATTTTIAATTTSTTTSTTTTSSSTTSPPAPVAQGCGGGPAIPVGTAVRWQCTFDDEFDQPTLDTSKWVAQQTATSGYTSGLTACFVDSPNNVSVSGGTLDLTAREEAAPFTCRDPYGDFTTRYTSGMVSTSGLFSQTYGVFEVRAELPAPTASGLQETFWLWPVDSSKYGAWPASGEIDFAEFYSEYPTLLVPYIHYNAAHSDPDVTSYDCTIADVAQFHTYDVEWTPSSITVFYDGRTCLTDDWDPAAPLSEPQPFDQPFLIALTQALGIGTNAFDPSTTPLPATTHIEYVRVWR